MFTMLSPRYALNRVSPARSNHTVPGSCVTQVVSLDQDKASKSKCEESNAGVTLSCCEFLMSIFRRSALGTWMMRISCIGSLKKYGDLMLRSR